MCAATFSGARRLFLLDRCAWLWNHETFLLPREARQRRMVRYRAGSGTSGNVATRRAIKPSSLSFRLGARQLWTLDAMSIYRMEQNGEKSHFWVMLVQYFTVSWVNLYKPCFDLLIIKKVCYILCISINIYNWNLEISKCMVIIHKCVYIITVDTYIYINENNRMLFLKLNGSLYILHDLLITEKTLFF